MSNRLKFQPFEPQKVSSESLERLPQPKIGAYGPRPVRMSARGKWGMGIVTMGTLAIAGFGIFTITKNLQERQLLVAEGMRAEAKVIDLRPTRSNYRVTYRYNVDGKSYDYTDTVKRGDYSGTEVGGSIPITVARNHPRVSRTGVVSKESVMEESKNDVIFGSIVILQFGIVMGALFWNKQRDLRVLSDWPAVTGKILDVKRRTSKHGPRYDLQVVFSGPVATTEKRFVVTHCNRWKPTVGEYVDVLYSPNNPAKSHLAQQLGMAVVVESAC